MVNASVSHVFLSETEYQIIHKSEKKGYRMVNKDKDNLNETLYSDEITCFKAAACTIISTSSVASINL